MYRNNFAANGPVPQPGPPASLNGRGGRLDARPPSRHIDSEDLVTHRPIIKEEDLSKMDDISRDVGWASHDDIDYNQKLAFSDDETDTTARNKENKIDNNNRNDTQQESSATHSRPAWPRGGSSRSGGGSGAGGGSGGSRISGEDDEGLVRRRQQHSEEVAIAVERAKQRKEEEEKKFLESKQAAAKKLKELEEKRKGKRDKDGDETQGTINPSIVPPQPITPAPIPVPDWEKEKDVKTNESGEEKSSSLDFKQLTKIEGEWDKSDFYWFLLLFYFSRKKMFYYCLNVVTLSVTICFFILCFCNMLIGKSTFGFYNIYLINSLLYFVFKYFCHKIFLFFSGVSREIFQKISFVFESFQEF